MRSVLISLDFIYKEDGTLTPLELNTNTLEEISEVKGLNNDNFLEQTTPYFNHEGLHSFLQQNNISKITTISQTGDNRFIRSFCNFYGYEHTLVPVSKQQITIPDVEDSDDTLIIRIAYDTYALIDDLYARDNYEFHNLIASESFASPIFFTENNLDTITEFESSQDGVIPNYVIKARTPGYDKTQYPKLYRFDSEDELNSLKSNLGSNEFIQKFEFNSGSSLIDDRTYHLRSMDLICGGDLEVINILNYKSFNIMSTTNSKVVIDYEIDDSKRLHPLNESKYYPTHLTKVAFSYHFDDTDEVLMSDGTLKIFDNIQIDDQVVSIEIEDSGSFTPITQEMIDSRVIGTTGVSSLKNKTGGIFVNITATSEEHGEFSWYDGVGNLYLKKPSSDSEIFYYTMGGNLEIGNEILIYNNQTNDVELLTVTDIYFDLKDIQLHSVSLKPTSEFLIKLSENNNDLFLIQHNSCNATRCFLKFLFDRGISGPTACSPAYAYCTTCGKNSPYCVDCGGNNDQDCEN